VLKLYITYCLSRAIVSEQKKTCVTSDTVSLSVWKSGRTKRRFQQRMGWIFNILTKASGFLAIFALALAISSGLYILAELSEEFPTQAGRCLRICFYVVMGMHILLLLDGVPFYSILGGVACQACYYLMILKFPFVELFSISTLLSLVACVCSHIIWFRYFMSLHSSSRDYHDYSSAHDLDMLEIVGFFLVMVWIIPCGLFVSLTVNDSSLPLSGSDTDLNGFHKKKVSVFKSVYDRCQSMLESVTRSKLSASSIVLDHRQMRASKYS